jgi:ATP-dependent DNA helicase RecG
MAPAAKEATPQAAPPVPDVAGARPPVLFSLFAPLTTLPGVGRAVERQLRRLLGREAPRVIDLLALMPTGVIDPRPLAGLAGAVEGAAVTLRVLIRGHRAPSAPNRPWRVMAEVAGEPLELGFFHARAEWLAARFAPGSEVLIHGRLGRWGERWQLAHPELLPAGPEGHGRPLALYPLAAGLGHGRMRKLVATALERVPALPEWLDPAPAGGEPPPDWRHALTELHAAPAGALALAASPARRRLAFDELLASQLAMALVRGRREAAGGRRVRGDGSLRAGLLARLPFSPTRAQSQATEEILADMARPQPMLRLLQGDVGSGKTLVALLAMLAAVEAGHQAALMAPTEVLARQHGQALQALAAPIGVEVLLLTGRDKGRRRDEALARLAAGTAPIAVGTHALFQSGVEFSDLALAVIDEQHRFGVHQRLELRAKGVATDLLLMTATPIPRTLLLSAYGDLATSRLMEKPAGRRPIRTSALPMTRLEELLRAVDAAVGRGERLYWICPSITAEAEADDAAAEARAEALTRRLGPAVGLAHGRLPAAERAAAMADFAAGRISLLVATTVVEVGIDVPAATIIVIERAERFGLAQLHQLRGRVGRGSRPSSCVLLYEPPLSRPARARLEAMRATDDGFAIAEQDLELRGPGEVLGVRQSGMPETRFADLPHDRDLLEAARDDAGRILAADPRLGSPRGRALRLLLHLFERQDAVRLLDAG